MVKRASYLLLIFGIHLVTNKHSFTSTACLDEKCNIYFSNLDSSILNICKFAELR